MKIAVTITGYIDVPDEWEDTEYGAIDVADYRYNDQLTVEDAIDELARKLKAYPEDFDAGFADE